MRQDTLATFPYVTVRIACSSCSRAGQYRLVRLAAKYGPDIRLDDLLEHLAGDCIDWRPRHPYKSRCGFFADLGPRMPPPDEPQVAAEARLKIVK